MSASSDASKNVAERIQSITQAETNLQQFLASFSELLNVIHDNKENPQSPKAYQALVDQCYSHLSAATVIMRRELKLKDQIGVPPNLHKRATNINDDKINQLLN